MKRRTRINYTEDQKAEIWDRWQNGESMHDIARTFDRFHTSVQGILTTNGGVRPRRRTRSERALSTSEREVISRGLASDLSMRAIARWCDLRRGDKHAWTKNIMAVGDFNLPEAIPGDPVFEALTDRGLKLPPHSTRIPTNVSNSSDYDQIAVTPGLTSKIVEEGVFDFDSAVFSNIFDANAPGYWRRCVKYYISDHRPLWIQFTL